MSYVQAPQAVPPTPKTMRRAHTIQPRPTGRQVSRRVVRRSELGDLSLAPLALISAGGKAKSVAKAIGSGVKKVLGMGPDPVKSGHRSESNAAAYQLAAQGNLAAFLYLRARSGRFDHRNFLIPVPPIPGLTPGGALKGWASPDQRTEAWTMYNNLKSRFPEVSSTSNVVSKPTTEGEIAPLPQLPPAGGGGSGGGVLVGPDGGIETKPAEPPVTEPIAQAGLGGKNALLFAGALGAAALLASVATGGRRRRGRGR